MRLTFITRPGKRFELNFAPTDTFRHVLTQATAHLNTLLTPGRASARPEKYRLVYKGLPTNSSWGIDLEKKLEDYEAKDGDSLLLVENQKGGPQPLSGYKRNRPNSNARKTRRARKNRRNTRRV